MTEHRMIQCLKSKVRPTKCRKTISSLLSPIGFAQGCLPRPARLSTAQSAAHLGHLSAVSCPSTRPSLV